MEETGQTPAGWSFDKAVDDASYRLMMCHMKRADYFDLLQADWWLEEHGLIMEKPDPLPPGNLGFVLADCVRSVFEHSPESIENVSLSAFAHPLHF